MRLGMMLLPGPSVAWSASSTIVSLIRKSRQMNASTTSPNQTMSMICIIAVSPPGALETQSAEWACAVYSKFFVILARAMRIPVAVRRLIESFEKLPGIGPKTAQRLTFYLLHVPQEQLESFAESLVNLKKNTVLCSICRNVGENDPCSICSDPSRDKGIVMVVEQPLDILALERSGKYKGIYHVLHGVINPLDNIGPDEIFIRELLTRVATDESRISEIILATNPTMEGEATAMYIKKQVVELGNGSSSIRITRLGVGVPTGADLEYADDTTLRYAIEGRREF